MSICTPYTVLEQVAAKLSAQVWLAQGQGGIADARAMRALLGAAPLELSVELLDDDNVVVAVVAAVVDDVAATLMACSGAFQREHAGSAVR